MAWEIVTFLYCIILTTASSSLFRFFSVWFWYLHSIHSFNAKCTVISVESKIGVKNFKTVQIIGRCTDTDSFMNEYFCILKIVDDMENPDWESILICDINVGSEGVIICNYIVGLIKINTLNMRTLIFTVACNEFPLIITVAFLNTCSNDWIE